MIGTINKNNVSPYQPSADVIALTAAVQKDYAQGDEILNRPWTELNDRSVIEDENRGKMMFNAFVDTEVDDPGEAWKWRGTRSMARNKGIAMHANLTANYLLPLFMAQNENDETDRDFSETMRDVIEWMAEPTNSNYQSSFLQVVFGMIQNPVTYLGAEYCEVFQTIKQKQEDGKYTTKEILDDVLSGFKAPIYSASEILITNAFERNIQKQRRIIKRAYKEKEELEAKYGDHPNWVYVQEGIKSVYNDEDGLFYDVKDDENPSLCVEETSLSRREDSEICFINGIYFGEDDVEANPIRHRDNRDAPKYNIVPFGYNRIGDHFFFYKSMMSAVGWDNMLYDALSEIVMNRAILETEMPVVVSGSDQIDSDVVFPNAVIAFEEKDARINPLFPNSNINAGFSALRETEKSITEGTVSETMSGQLPQASQKAFSVAQAQANSRTIMKGVGKSLGESVVMYGSLMKDIAINHITVAQVDEIVGEGMKLKYKTLLLENKMSAGKMMDKQIKFDADLIGKEMTPKEREYASLELLEKRDGTYGNSKMSIMHVNPEIFAKFNYLCKVDIEEMFAKNQEYWQPVLSNLYAQLRQDPLIDGEALVRRLTYAYFRTDGDDLIKKQSAAPPIQMPPQGGDQSGAGGPAKAGDKKTPLGSMVENQALGAISTESVLG